MNGCPGGAEQSTTHACDRALQGAAAIEDASDSATALPQQMAVLLSACSKLEDLGLAVSAARPAGVVESGGSVRCQLSPSANLTPLGDMVNLQSLNVSHFHVSDITPLISMCLISRPSLLW
jgi:hypothetical protein